MRANYGSITNFFEEILSDLNCQHDTKAYIVSIFDKYKAANLDLSKDSVTLLFAQARYNHDFLRYQNLGDWIFFINSFAPNHFGELGKTYCNSIARLSYYSCYKIINKQWKLFEELSDNLPILEIEVHKRLNSIKS